jgi:ribonuclease R
MDVSIGVLLASFADDKLIAPKALEKRLDCETPEDSHRLEIALDALERIGILVKERGKYRRVPDVGLVEGKLRCSSKGFCFAIQESEEAEDIYIRESQLNSAWNGDRVLVKVTKEGRRRRSPEGEVRVILERANPSVIAHVRKVEEGQYRAVPLDDRLLFELDLRERDTEIDLENTIDHLVHAEVVRYPLGSQLPVGRITQVLGSDAQSAADIELVFCKYDLPRSFPEEVEVEAQALPTKLRKADQKGRLNLKTEWTVTIGDASVGDAGLDYALSLEPQAKGGWRLLVHIADLQALIEVDSELDHLASQRGVTIGLDETLVPLFPPAVVERVGALLADKERLALSLEIILNAQGEVVSYQVNPSVISVDLQCNYSQLQEALNGSTEGLGGSAAVAQQFQQWIEQFKAATEKLREQRLARGGFDLSLPEIYPRMHGEETRLGVLADVVPPTGRLQVAECLTLANQLLTAHLQALGVPTLFQVQSPPDPQKLQDFLRLSENLGLQFELARENVVTPQDYRDFTAKFRDLEAAPILYELLAETLEPVSYSNQPGPHFGLAHVQNYGQFTSPLNRYGDLINQRILSAVFELGRDRKTARAKEQVDLHSSDCHDKITWNVLPPEIQRDFEGWVEAMVIPLNEQLQLARQAESDLVGLQKTKKMQQRIGQVYQGYITGIQSYGFFVRLDDLLVEGLVHVSSLKDDWYEYRARQQTLIGRRNRQQYRLGDRVEVEIKGVDYYRQQIDLGIVGGGSEAPEEDGSPENLPWTEDYSESESYGKDELDSFEEE